MHAERNPPTIPPCITCRIPLRPENEDAGRIFQIVRGQVLTRFNGEHDVVVDLNHVAVWAAIDAYGVTMRTATFEKVMRLFHQIEAERRE